MSVQFTCPTLRRIQRIFSAITRAKPALKQKLIYSLLEMGTAPCKHRLLPLPNFTNPNQSHLPRRFACLLCSPGGLGRGGAVCRSCTSPFYLSINLFRSGKAFCIKSEANHGNKSCYLGEQPVPAAFSLDTAPPAMPILALSHLSFLSTASPTVTRSGTPRAGFWHLNPSVLCLLACTFNPPPVILFLYHGLLN